MLEGSRMSGTRWSRVSAPGSPQSQQTPVAGCERYSGCLYPLRRGRAFLVRSRAFWQALHGERSATSPQSTQRRSVMGWGS